MQQDKSLGNFTARANCLATPSGGVSTSRKRRHPTDNKLRYAKRRFSPLKPEDLMEVDHSGPTHYLRVIFPPSRNWHVSSGHMLDDVHSWLQPYGAKPVNEYHVTLALLCCRPDARFHDFTPLANAFRNVVFELCDFNILGRTLVLNAHELHHHMRVPINMALTHVREWLTVHGYTIHNSGLPLHLSVSKLHDIDENTRSYLGSSAFLTQYITRMTAKPIALELVTIRGNPNNHKKIVQSIPI